MAKNFIRLVNQMNLKQEFISPAKVRMYQPGFSFEAFNSCGYIKPWSMMYLAESHRIKAWAGIPTPDGVKSFMDFVRLTRNHFSFTVAAKLDVSKQLYDGSLKKGPLISEMEIVNMEDKSFCLRMSTFLEDSLTPLYTVHAQSITVDMKTRKATANPDWLMDLKNHVTSQSEGVRPERVPVEGRPPLSSEYRHIVSADDVDAYSHLSWTNSVKLCYNAYIVHLRNTGKSIHGINRQVKSITVNYLKEVPLGSQLDVFIWDSEQSPDSFDFQIQHHGTVTDEVHMEFYPQEIKGKF